MKNPVGGINSYIHEARGMNLNLNLFLIDLEAPPLILLSFSRAPSGSSDSTEAFLSNQRSQVTVNPKNILHVLSESLFCYVKRHHDHDKFYKRKHLTGTGLLFQKF